MDRTPLPRRLKLSCLSQLSPPALSAVIQTDTLRSLLQTEQRKASQFKTDGGGGGVMSVFKGYIQYTVFYVPEHSIMHLTVSANKFWKGRRLGGGQWEGLTLRL